MKHKTRAILFWDEWTIEHIKKHKVNLSEIREAFKSRKIVEQSYKGRPTVIGKTKKGRILIIVLSYELQKEAYIISARDCSKKEREKFYETKANQTI